MIKIRTMIRGLVAAGAVACIAVLPSGCIKNDLPYPRIPQNIRELAAVGETRSANIDSVTLAATVYLGEDVDIEKVRFSTYRTSPDARSSLDLLNGEYDMSKPLYVTLSLYQDYDWTISAVQEIERYFRVEGEIGESLIDPVAKRVIVKVPDNIDLKQLRLLDLKLGPAGHTEYNPELKPGLIDLSYPMRVEVTSWGRTEIWTIYAEVIDAVVMTTQVDAWSKVIWVYGAGPSDVRNGFQYRKAGEDAWIDVPESNVTQTQGSCSCYISGLEPLTEYEVRSVSGENTGNIMKATTQATADIPNGDFEDWYQGGAKNNLWIPCPAGGPVFWDTGNTGSITMGKNVTIPSDHTPTGSGRSAQLATEFVGIGMLGKLAAGSIYTGKFMRVDGTNGILNFGRPWTLRPTRLTGFYQYKTKAIDYVSSEFDYLKGRPDTCVIYVALADWTAPYEVRTNPKNRQLFDPNSPSIIAYGELQCGHSMDNFEPFSIDIKYRDTSRVPTYLQITCSASKYGDYFTGASGATLWVDQFAFEWDY